MSSNDEAAGRGSPFWRFSLGFYRRPGVADACIALQDAHGADVNVLLLALFLSAEGRLLSPDEFGSIAGHVGPWNAGVVAPLRALRRMLKTAPPLVGPARAELFRNKVKSLELEAERLQQETLFERARASPLGRAASRGPETARANIAALEAAMGGAFPAAPVDLLIEQYRDMLAEP